MPIDDRELQAIAFLALRVRKATYGCGPWDELGLVANLRKIQNRNLHMTIEHVLRHAADPNAKSPGVIVGSFTPPAPKPGPFRPLKANQQCRECGGERGACGCQLEHLAVERDETPHLPPLEAVNPGLAARLKNLTPHAEEDPACGA